MGISVVHMCLFVAGNGEQAAEGRERGRERETHGGLQGSSQPMKVMVGRNDIRQRRPLIVHSASREGVPSSEDGCDDDI